MQISDQHLRFRYTDSTIPLLFNPKFQASSHLLWQYSPVCVGPGQKPEDQFSQNEAQINFVFVNVDICDLVHDIEPIASF